MLTFFYIGSPANGQSEYQKSKKNKLLVLTVLYFYTMDGSNKVYDNLNTFLSTAR